MEENNSGCFSVAVIGAAFIMLMFVAVIVVSVLALVAMVA